MSALVNVNPSHLIQTHPDEQLRANWLSVHFGSLSLFGGGARRIPSTKDKRPAAQAAQPRAFPSLYYSKWIRDYVKSREQREQRQGTCRVNVNSTQSSSRKHSKIVVHKYEFTTRTRINMMFHKRASIRLTRSQSFLRATTNFWELYRREPRIYRHNWASPTWPGRNFSQNRVMPRKDANWLTRKAK